MTKRVVVDLLSYTGTKGGMEVYARELYRALGKLDTEFEFIGLASKEGYQLDQSWFPGEMVDSGISGENRFVWAWGELFGVSRWAKRLGADLVHSPATLGPAKTKMPTVMTMHDMLYWSHPEYMSTPFYTGPVKWMERRAANNATRVMTISQVSADEIKRYLKVPAERLDLVPLAGTPTAPIAAATRPEHPYILATGNRRPHKNWPSLIRALPLIDETIRPRVVVTGSRGEDPLLVVVEEVGMTDWVELKSWVTDEEMAELYAGASAMAMPSFCDGFSLPALEAMMMGIPVMLSDIPVYREVAGDAALYFDPTDLQSIADSMVEVVTNPERMQELVAAGHEQSAKYSWDRVARRTADVFRAALSDPR